MSDQPGYDYPDRVRHEIAEDDHSAYRRAADFINNGHYEVLSIQHEYGIFGGTSGADVLSLAREVKIPIVTTLHTVLRQPSESQRTVLEELMQLSERVVVMSQTAVQLMADVYRVDPGKVDFIPHGIPSITEAAGMAFRAELQIDGPMILTFGLLSPDKGIEFVIRAMPRILADHPNATYVIVGATHPHVRASAGESYRMGLTALAEELGVADNVRFVNRFVALDELVQYLSATDFYVTPYLNPMQITSGTLAYSVGAGKAVLSTPYIYAEELLADGRGILVPFRNSEAIADAVIETWQNTEARIEMGRRAWEHGRAMQWPHVGELYMDTFARAIQDSAQRMKSFTKTALSLPTLRLDHLIELSDDTGILQHATLTVANRDEGYCVDDNARALLLTAMLGASDRFSPGLDLMQARYLSFVQHAFNPATGWFRNFMSYDRRWLESKGSEDSHGRSLWALGAMVNRCQDSSRREVARRLFHSGIGALAATTSPRTWAYAVLACDEYLTGYPNEPVVLDLLKDMAGRLWDRYAFEHTEDWPWFEYRLAYANARLPQAMILAGQCLGRRSMVERGLDALGWLMKNQTSAGGLFCPVGMRGAGREDLGQPTFDQQPLEAWSSMSACLSAWKVTGDGMWHNEAQKAFGWFLGDNVVGLPICDPEKGGCRDGLHEDRTNENQGAESTLSYLCALAEFEAVLERRASVLSRVELR